MGDDTGTVSVLEAGNRLTELLVSPIEPVALIQDTQEPVQAINPASDSEPADTGAEAVDDFALTSTNGFFRTDEDSISDGGAKTKFRQNIAAIKLLKTLTAESRQAIRVEQAVLANYVGWGGLPQAFERDGGETTKGWAREVAELKGLLTAEELESAAASTRNAHYTSPEIVSGMWAAAQHFGFTGGRTLEPSAGVGNFFSLMPQALSHRSELVGVELDRITGGLAKQLHPQANIAAPVAFQNFETPDDYFDLVIGNPPFGAECIYDPLNKDISGFSIHNYFFAKSIDSLRPNGVLAMVVTSRLLDSAKDTARNYIAERAEFVGAIRLPNNAFLKNAGTEVTTDVIFLRKLKDLEKVNRLKVDGKDGSHAWTEVGEFTDANGVTVPLNEYFVNNPHMMLGDFGAYGSMYRADDTALIARPGQDTAALLNAAIATLPSNFMDAPRIAPVTHEVKLPIDISAIKIGSVFKYEDKIYERCSNRLGTQMSKVVEFSTEKARERVIGMIALRDALITLRTLQLDSKVSDNDLTEARKDLNSVYDAFVKSHGPINLDANKRLMRDDPTWPQLSSLEENFDKGVSAAIAKSTGEKARPPKAEKAAIFQRRTQYPYHSPAKADSAKDALVFSLSEYGRVNMDYMCKLYDKSPKEVAQELTGIIFKTPEGEWESRDEYLSGNVKLKLKQAIEAAKTNPEMHENVEALRLVQPEDVDAVDINVKTGAHWIPVSDMDNFLNHITSGRNCKSSYGSFNAKWNLSADSIPESVKLKYGTDRVGVVKIIEAAANAADIVVRDKDIDGKIFVNSEETSTANERVELVHQAWREWLWSDDDRRERLVRIYNDTFNTDVEREYDGSHLTFPGKVGDDVVQLRPHQKNAIWRTIQSATLLDHSVGTGKTYTMIAAAMEMKRMGLASKPMVAVPNHIINAAARDCVKLYPNANILVVTERDTEKANRKKFYARIATGDYSIILVTHSSLGKLAVDPKFQAIFIRKQIEDLNLSVAELIREDPHGRKSRNVKKIEKSKAVLEQKLISLFDTGAKDDNLNFTELGIDLLFVDEAHNFKNLGFSTSMTRIAGLGNTTGSKRASDMFMKIRSVLDRSGGRNVVLATGTPISNTMAEMYTWQRFLNYEKLKELGVLHFDAWAKTFGKVVSDWELSPTGQYKMNSRFAKFVNMPELMKSYKSFADVITRDDVDRMLAILGQKLPVPQVAGGKPSNIVVKRSPEQAAYIGIPLYDQNGVEYYAEDSLIYRAEHLPKGRLEKGSDNMLVIMSCARKAALDMRLIDPSLPDFPGSKVNVAVKNIKDIYDKWTYKKGAQLVFCDLSTPKSSVTREVLKLRALIELADKGDEAAQNKLDDMSPDEFLALDSKFSVYDDLKAKLIASGIPAYEIAFIHDAHTSIQMQELQSRVRSGSIRVLIGSTPKMGEGMNVQDRLVALHHLDTPWVPKDLEQREGRIIRQGNLLEPLMGHAEAVEGFEVEILRYASEQTLDSRMWQTIEGKARFIDQIRRGTNEREVEDVRGEAMNASEMKAASSGNPLILEEINLKSKIRTLETQYIDHDRGQHKIKDGIRFASLNAKSQFVKAQLMEQDLPLIPELFEVKVGLYSYDKHAEAGLAILSKADELLNSSNVSIEIGHYGGFKLILDKAWRSSNSQTLLLIAKGSDELQIEFNKTSSPQGLAIRLQNAVKSLPLEISRLYNLSETNLKDIPNMEAQIKPWDKLDELNEMKIEHAIIIEKLKPKKKEDVKLTPVEPATSSAKEFEEDDSDGDEDDSEDYFDDDGDEDDCLATYSPTNGG